MKENPYSSTPTSSTSEEKPLLLRDLPKEKRREMILAGDTTAGPLAVFLYEHPIWSALIGICAVSAFFYGCWTSIQS